MKIYTRTGDKGETRLFGGEKVNKDNLLIEAYGTVDELNASLGVVNSVLINKFSEVKDIMVAIQSELHIICANLADQTERKDKPAIQPRHIETLESHCDRFDQEIPELKKFIIPGGGFEASLVHQARTVCRRAERRAVSASNDYAVNPDVIRYLNRLSDLLFILARYLNFQNEIAEQHPDYSK